MSAKPVITELRNYCQESVKPRAILNRSAGVDIKGRVQPGAGQTAVRGCANSGRCCAANLLERRFCHSSALPAAPLFPRVDHVFSGTRTFIGNSWLARESVRRITGNFGRRSLSLVPEVKKAGNPSSHPERHTGKIDDFLNRHFLAFPSGFNLPCVNDPRSPGSLGPPGPRSTRVAELAANTSCRARWAALHAPPHGPELDGGIEMGSKRPRNGASGRHAEICQPECPVRR